MATCPTQVEQGAWLAPLQEWQHVKNGQFERGTAPTLLAPIHQNCWRGPANYCVPPHALCVERDMAYGSRLLILHTQAAQARDQGQEVPSVAGVRGRHPPASLAASQHHGRRRGEAVVLHEGTHIQSWSLGMVPGFF